MDLPDVAAVPATDLQARSAEAAEMADHFQRWSTEWSQWTFEERRMLDLVASMLRSRALLLRNAAPAEDPRDKVFREVLAILNGSKIIR